MKALLCVAWLVVAPIASAQVVTPAEPPTTIEILVLPALGASATVEPIASLATLISATSVNCNRTGTPLGPTPLINPTHVEFVDPFHAGKVCQVPVPAGLQNAANLRIVGVFSGASGVDGARSLVGTPFFDIAGTVALPAVPAAVVVRP